jgi:predicted DNA-binding transcriptional regulator AlpA
MEAVAKKRGRPRRPLPRDVTPEERRASSVGSRRQRAVAAAAEFSSYPDEGRVRQPVIEVLCQISSATVWRWVQQGKLPQPRRDGRITTWRVGDIRRVLAGAGEVAQ